MKRKMGDQTSRTAPTSPKKPTIQLLRDLSSDAELVDPLPDDPEVGLAMTPLLVPLVVAVGA